MERRFIFLKTSAETQLSENFILEANKHIGKCFKTCTSGAWKPSVLTNSQLQFSVLQPGVGDFWKYYSANDQDQVNLSNCISHNEAQLDELGDQIHSCLDLLPTPGTYLLDIVWFCDAPPREFPPALFGALKRSVAWHGAMLSVITEEHTGADVAAWFSPLRAEVLPMSMLCTCHSLSELLCASLVWRGSLAFYNHQDTSSFKIQGFELQATRDVFDWTSGELGSKSKTSSSRVYFSGSLEVVSEVDLSSVPPHLLTRDKLVLKTSSLGDDDILASEFMCETFPCPSSALVVKLKYSLDKPRVDLKKLKTEDWKSCVSYNIEMTSPAQSMGEDVSSISLLVFDDPDLSEDCTRNVLQKSAVVFKNVQDLQFASSLKEMTHEGVVRCDKEKIARAKDLINFPKFHVDESKIEVVKNYVNEVQVEVINALTLENSPLIQDNLIEDVRIAITAHLMKTLNFPVMFTSVEENDFLYPEPLLKTVNPEEWQETRFLAFLQKHHDKAEREIRESQPNKQIKDYVLLEAKELLKFFNEDGLAADVKNLESIEAKNRNCPLRPHHKSEEDYHKYFLENFKKVTHDYTGFEFTGNYKDFTKMEFTQHHDVYYNNGEKAETYDKDCTKMQLLHVGLTRETASTFVSGPDTERLPVPPRQLGGAAESNKENKIRKSPRKKLAPPKRPGLVAKKSPKMDKSSSVNKVARPQAARNLQLAKKPTKSPSKKSAPLKPLPSKLNPKAGGASSGSVGSVSGSKVTTQPSKPLVGIRTEAVKGPVNAQKVETPEEANVKKLRVAVYAAITQEGVVEKDSMFKPCFRKLFNMVKMCLQEAMSKRDDSIADMMYDMAKMNVKNVITMEKMTRK